MKRLKKIFIFCLIIFISIPVIFEIYKGYSLYKYSTASYNIEEKINQVQNSDNYVKIENISPTFLNAIVSIEDHRFYEHNGIDYIAVCSALYHNLLKGKIVMGGSTITQQLAKNLFLTNEQTFERKIAEIILAKKIEREYSKKEILELYSNVIYYGDGYYGIKDAAKGYFNCTPLDLTEGQAILMAGLPQSPENYSLTKNYAGAKARSLDVLNSMIENRVLTEKKAKKLYSVEINKICVSY